MAALVNDLQSSYGPQRSLTDPEFVIKEEPEIGSPSLPSSPTSDSSFTETIDISEDLEKALNARFGGDEQLMSPTEVAQWDNRIADQKQALEQSLLDYKEWEKKINKRKRAAAKRLRSLGMQHSRRMELYDDFNDYAIALKTKLNKTDSENRNLKRLNQTPMLLSDVKVKL